MKVPTASLSSTLRVEIAYKGCWSGGALLIADAVFSFLDPDDLPTTPLVKISRNVMRLKESVKL
jgi:hypothetical protein